MGGYSGFFKFVIGIGIVLLAVTCISLISIIYTAYTGDGLTVKLFNELLVRGGLVVISAGILVLCIFTHRKMN